MTLTQMGVIDDAKTTSPARFVMMVGLYPCDRLGARDTLDRLPEDDGIRTRPNRHRNHSGRTKGRPDLRGSCEPDRRRHGPDLGRLLSPSGTPLAAGLTLSDDALESLPSEPTSWVLPFHRKASATPFTHVLIDYNPHGHEPPGVYDLPHFDVHFYIIPSAERMGDRAGGSRIRHPPSAAVHPGFLHEDPGGRAADGQLTGPTCSPPSSTARPSRAPTSGGASTERSSSSSR